MFSPEHAAVSALSVCEVRLQEHVLVDPAHQAVDVRGDLLICVHQGQHNVQGFLPVTWKVPPVLTHTNKNTRGSETTSTLISSGLMRPGKLNSKDAFVKGMG